MNRPKGCLSVATALAMLLSTAGKADSMPPPHKTIGISSTNPWYWEYGGKPVLPLGGSVEDNLFQIHDLEAHLDLLASVGGNYVRNTMSARDEGNVWPFKAQDGRYDLDQWNDEYWGRFEQFLALTAERDIIVQIEVWATFDYYRDCWDRNPFNPKNNVNYTVEESGLPTAVNSHPTRCENNFFWSVPAERNQGVVLKYQRRFVDKMLADSLQHGHVLYCMDNETSVTPAWGKYWAQYIGQRAGETGVSVHTTEMWDRHNLTDSMHNATFDHPETYSFVDISQNNHQRGQRHWDNAQRVRQRLAKQPRPMNNVKIYGADTGRFGNARDGIERFWRNVFGGMAAARFHRPDSGIGLSEPAQANLRSMRMLTDGMDIFSCAPHNDLLSDRELNEAYCVAHSGKEYAVYFPDGGQVTLDLSAAHGKVSVSWLDITRSQWQPTEPIKGGGVRTLAPPTDGYWAALVQVAGRR